MLTNTKILELSFEEKMTWFGKALRDELLNDGYIELFMMVGSEDEVEKVINETIDCYLERLV